MSRTIPDSSIVVINRQREERPRSHINELKQSIKTKGLLHAPVFISEGETNRLLVGECRLTAMRELHKEGISFNHDGAAVAKDTIPCIYIGDLTPDELLAAELEENIIRLDLPWQDKARALAAIHDARQANNPKQTIQDTAKEIATRTDKSPRHLHSEITKASVVAAHLNDPKIAAARTQDEAFQLINKKEGEKWMAQLAKRRQAERGVADEPSIKIINADLMEHMAKMDDATVDLILADPPYGIGAHKGGFRQRTVHHHNYEDTPENALAIAQALLSEGFRVTKQRANIFIFCDIDLFPTLKIAASRLGWVPWRRPIIWQKSESEGLAPWGAEGFRYTHDYIFWATKGQRGLVASPVDVLTYKRVSRSERLHAAEKPIELLKLLISCSTLPGDMVLDPCCGSGSTLIAAKQLNRLAIGIEKDPDHYTTAMANVFSKEEEGEKNDEPTADDIA